MKNLLLTTLLTLLIIGSATHATEPDTIWTIGAKQNCWFSPDGTKILVRTHKCLNTSDGSVVWDGGNMSPNGFFSQDSLYFYDREFAKFRISDGVKVADKPDFDFDTIPDFFMAPSSIYTKPAKSITQFMMPDENIFYYFYQQDYLSLDGERLATQSLICKYDKALDSIVKYVPLVKGTDTLIKGSAEIIGYVSPNNTILVKFDDDTTYRQYNASTLDSASQFIYDREKYGRQREQKISYNGKYLGFGTTDGESKLGWIVIYDLTNNSMYNKFLERDSTEYSSINRIAFSRNDSFLVSTSDMLRDSRTKIWNFHTGTHIHTYDFEYTAARSIDVSPDNNKIIAPNGLRTSLLRARWTPVTSVEDESEESELMLVYPNPGTDEVRIDLTNHTLKDVVESVKVFNVLGIEHPVSTVSFLRKQESPVNTDEIPGQAGNDSSIIRLDVSHLPPGVYFVQIGSRVQRFVKM